MIKKAVTASRIAHRRLAQNAPKRKHQKGNHQKDSHLQGGKLLTIRIVPTVALARDRFLKDLNARFEKASFYRTSHYSEFVLEAKGKLGNPYTASDTTGLFKLCIPYQSQKSRFSLTKGEKVADGLYFYKDHIKTGSLENDIFILRIEPLSDKIKVIPALANEGIAQRESPYFAIAWIF